MSRTKIFISYSHEDEPWRKRVASHLGVLDVEGLINLWDDQRLKAGDDWFVRIHEEMLKARVAVLLVSSAFLTSKFIREEEVPKLFGEHERAGMAIYPLLVKPCPWQEVGWLARLQVRPANGRAVARYTGAKRDEVLAEVAREISSMVKAQVSGASVPASAPLQGAASVPEISGEWKADVTYDWPNAHYTEVFAFTVEGDEVFGTASFLGRARAMFEGRLTESKLTFFTKTLTITSEATASDWSGRGGERKEVTKPEIHRYRGTVLADKIQFVMQTESDASEHLPVTFTAVKSLAAPSNADARERGGAANRGGPAKEREHPAKEP